MININNIVGTSLITVKNLDDLTLVPDLRDLKHFPRYSLYALKIKIKTNNLMNALPGRLFLFALVMLP